MHDERVWSFGARPKLCAIFSGVFTAVLLFHFLFVLYVLDRRERLVALEVLGRGRGSRFVGEGAFPLAAGLQRASATTLCVWRRVKIEYTFVPRETITRSILSYLALSYLETAMENFDLVYNRMVYHPFHLITQPWIQGFRIRDRGLYYCISCYFHEGFIFANFASQTLMNISTSIHVYL